MQHPCRSPDPSLIRRDGVLVEATWEDALEYVAEQASGEAGQRPGCIRWTPSSRCTNEDLYVFQKFMRRVIGTNRIDSSARYGHLGGVRALQQVQGPTAGPSRSEDIVAANALLLVGTNITETSPITGLKVKEAVKKRQAVWSRLSRWNRPSTLSNIANLAATFLCPSRADR